MEKWARSLSKTNALIFGLIGLIAAVALAVIANNFVGGVIGIVVLGAFLGGGIGFSLPLIYKGLTGLTPQEKKELAQKAGN